MANRYGDDDAKRGPPGGFAGAPSKPAEDKPAPALLASALGGRATDLILDEGGYVKVDGDDAWWVPSGRQMFAPGQFYLPVTFDVEGNPLAVIDARGNEAQRNVFGMGGRKLHQKSCDAGERWMLGDVAGKPLRAWDGRGFTQRAVYDAARRATHLHVQPAGGAEMLVERTMYGEALGAGAIATNQRGKVYQHFDGAGLVTSVTYDFKGNLLGSTRRLATEYHTQANWNALAALTDPAAIAAAAEAMLEAEVFAAATAYDALNRPVSLTTPDQSVVLPAYSEASLLEQVLVQLRGAKATTTFVDHIGYDAKGQRESIVYGQGATTTLYAYDPETFRLTQLKTTRASDGGVLQNLAYTYDPVGNITEIRDSAQQKVFFDNNVVLPKMAYVYDALYRLMQATGREQAGGLADVPRDQNDVPLLNLPHANDVHAVRNYTESYGYDAVGNILRMIHDSGAAATSWTRNYDIDGASNRLLGTSAPGDQAGQFSAKYGYDAHGNMTRMPHLASVGWSYRDEMASADMGGGGVVYFTYDAAGQRVRKVWEHSGIIEERIYLGGYEVYRKRDSSGVALERQTLHVMDGVKRIALVETTTVGASAAVTRFQLGNHLGSAVVEVDETGKVISYEEYHPYGTTAYHAGTGAAEVSLKRYRYTGKERDEETGLYYHGARYYAPWLGRWTSADPAGMVDGTALYTYVKSSPVCARDATGHESTGTVDQQIAQMTDKQLIHRINQMKSEDPAGLATFRASATGAFAARVDAVLTKPKADQQIARETDAQLHARMKAMSPTERGALLTEATGAFNARAQAMRVKYDMETVFVLPKVEVEVTPPIIPFEVTTEGDNVKVGGNITIVNDPNDKSFMDKALLDLAIMSTYDSGYTRLDSLVNAPYPVQISHEPGNKGGGGWTVGVVPHEASEAWVNYNPDLPTLDRDNPKPSDATLFHELQHAHNIVLGDTAPTPTNDEWVREEEKNVVVGRPGHDPTLDPSENDYLREIGYPYQRTGIGGQYAPW